MSSSLKERLPEVLPLFRDSRLSTVIEAIQAEFDDFKSDTEDVQDSLFVNSADGGSLDQIGADFGLIGRRRGRGDTAYRQFLRSVVPAFDGRGTERDVEVAVGAGVARAPRFVDLRQDFSNREYEVELFDWSAHRTGTVHDLADLADPVAVDRVDPVYYFSDEVAVAIAPAPTETGIETVGGTASPALTTGETVASIFAVGLSSDDLEPLSTDGFVLSIRDAPAARIIFDPPSVELATNPVSPAATPRAGAGGTSIRQMTRLSGATPAIDSDATDATTLTRDGLSSAQLGGLSTTQIPQLST